MAEADNFEEDLFADLYEDDAPAKEEAALQPKSEASAPIEAKQEVKAEDAHPHEEGDQQMYGGGGAGDDDDDEIDFNLGGNENGNGGDYDAPAQQHHEYSGPGIKEDGKMFIGGLNWETTDQSLKDYFSQFGEVLECTVMRDGASGRSRGFGFLTFKDARTVNIVMVKEHFLDGKIIDPKRAIPRDEQERTSKIFVGGVSQEATEQDFKEFFTQFGRVVDATLMMDKDTGRPRGFGFVTFDSEAAVDACLQGPLEILNKPIEVKKAQPRGNIREEEDNKFGSKNGARGGNGSSWPKGNEQGMNQQQNNQNAATNGMTPQMMAQYFQRMQQYFAMMQQNQAAMQMGGGMGGMNPQMMQQMQAMQMAQMQQAMAAQQGAVAGARSVSPQSPAGMNPQMMAQMQAMQQQAMGGGGGGNNFAAGGANNPGGRIGTPGYNAYEQQVFEQQKYERQSMMRGREQSQGNFGGQGYGGGGQGGPTSWEGMYDDVPQPSLPTPSGGAGRGGYGGGRGGSKSGSQPPDPAKAPPANAPTGPKNAGKPGANYRGGGRGGQRGFHPYAR